MPRGRKPETRSYAEQIADLDLQIDGLKIKRKKLIAAKEKEEYGRLMAAVRETGIPLEDCIALLNEKKAGQTESA